jgi:hypothetical protein
MRGLAPKSNPYQSKKTANPVLVLGANSSGLSRGFAEILLGAILP